MSKRPKIIVIGAGFGGLQTALSLGGAPAEVWLVDRHAYHTFVPLLYQVATATLVPELIALPVQTLTRRHPNLRFVHAEVQAIDPRHQRVETNRGSLDYDYLVLATGSQLRLHTLPGAEDYALPLGTLDDAIQLRNHILGCFEQAAWESNPHKQQELLSFTIVGGGTTGVEMAGALVELMQGTLRRDYPHLDPRLIRVTLLHTGLTLLAEFPRHLGQYTLKRLRKMGVTVHLGTRVEAITATAVHLQEGTQIHTATVIWAAGVTPVVPISAPTLQRSPSQRLQVRPTLQLIDHPEIYAIGDVAEVQGRGQPLAGVAPVALQQGVATACNLRRQMAQRPLRRFRYLNKGRLAIIGGYAGIGQIGPIPLVGVIPWLMWLMVHWVYLPGYLSRLQVLLTWINAYLWGDRTVRQHLGASTSPQPDSTAVADASLPLLD
ncbi:NAD(P)/FAD-dependent oxidoreductase [Lyngbya confervoides]|uniref:NAD(P)/FAD-dependent oxidoreductase n=1 Tax=Lyngbya confervoides BDU141951 TaxID=1574623 RepID=A0ABD4T007_9CYAN|nr:NAD(P)/FAD-dependent oxidoreductase [Lyngbya confervoides]MCM1982041.1 NAD(P)/FAD-dependent oxidoreductase [Lyngbya confervoides BDU141951]